MSEKKFDGKKAATLLLGIMSFVESDLGSDLVEWIKKHVGNKLEQNNELIPIPKLFVKGFILTAEQATEILEAAGLKVTVVPLSTYEANKKYGKLQDSQVVGTEPKAGCKVKPGSNVIVKYITQDVIDESQRLYEEEQKEREEKAINAKKKRDERNEKLKEKAGEFAVKAKEIGIDAAKVAKEKGIDAAQAAKGKAVDAAQLAKEKGKDSSEFIKAKLNKDKGIEQELLMIQDESEE